MKYRYFSATALVLMTGWVLPSFAQHDDVYYDPDRDRPAYSPVQNTSAQTQTVDWNNSNPSTGAHTQHPDDLQYYDDEYADDLEYVSRVRRYHRYRYTPTWGYSYYDYYFADPFYYDPFYFDRFYYRPMMTMAFGRRSYWDNYWARPVYSGWYDWDYAYNWNPYFYQPWGCNTWGWNTWGWNSGWNSWGWNRGWGNSYWNGYNDGYNDGYWNARNRRWNNNVPERHWNPHGVFTGARTAGSTLSPASPRVGRETVSPRHTPTVDDRPTSSGRVTNPRNPNGTTPTDVQRGDNPTTRVAPTAPTRTYERPTRVQEQPQPQEPRSNGRSGHVEHFDSTPEGATTPNNERPTRTYERPTRTYERPTHTEERPTRTYERPSSEDNSSSPSRYERRSESRSESPRYDSPAPSRSETRSAPSRSETRSAPSRSETRSSPSRSESSPSRSSSSGSSGRSSSPRSPRQ